LGIADKFYRCIFYLEKAAMDQEIFLGSFACLYFAVIVLVSIAAAI
jgi:hypothetical protein